MGTRNSVGDIVGSQDRIGASDYQSKKRESKKSIESVEGVGGLTDPDEPSKTKSEFLPNGMAWKFDAL